MIFYQITINTNAINDTSAINKNVNKIEKFCVLPFSPLHVAGFQTYFFWHTWHFLHSYGHLSFLHRWSELHFLPSNLHIHSHHICFVNVFNSFIPVIMLSTLRFKSSFLFGTHTLLDKSLRVLQLPTHLSNLTANE